MAREPAVHDADQPIGDHLLRPIEASQERAGGVADFVGNHGAVGLFELEGGEDQLTWGFEQFFGKRNQLIRRQSTMTLVHRLGQRVGYSGAQSDCRFTLIAETGRVRHFRALPETRLFSRHPNWDWRPIFVHLKWD